MGELMQRMFPVRTDPETGRVLDPWEVSLGDYLDLKPPQQAKFWRRVHRASVAWAVRAGKLSRQTALTDYTESELVEADRAAEAIRARTKSGGPDDLDPDPGPEDPRDAPFDTSQGF